MGIILEREGSEETIGGNCGGWVRALTLASEYGWNESVKVDTSGPFQVDYFDDESARSFGTALEKALRDIRDVPDDSVDLAKVGMAGVTSTEVILQTTGRKAREGLRQTAAFCKRGAFSATNESVALW